MAIRTRLTVGVVIALATIAITATVTLYMTAPTVTRPRTTALFTDDFDGHAGAAVDETRWQHETGDNVINHEGQWYTSGTNNAALDGNGHLIITAKRDNPGNHTCWYGPCEYTSARLTTAGRFTQTYGHFEARMKLPVGPGMWPAFWLLGNDCSAEIDPAGWPDCGEIDVMENVGYQPGIVHGSLHGPGYSRDDCITGEYSLPGGKIFSDDFHTFAVDWTPGWISFSVDGVVYQNKTPADANGNRWVFDHPFYIILNLAVGGDWPGDPDGSTKFPQELIVDYVHVSGNN